MTPEELAEELQGTCKPLPELDETIEFYEELDSLVFNCDCCGWWCESCEENLIDGEQFCNDCYSDHLEEEAE